MATISVFEHTGVGDVITGHQSDAHKPKGGAADRCGGTKQDSRAKRAKKKFCTPHFSKCGVYKQANISRGLLNILKFAVWLTR